MLLQLGVSLLLFFLVFVGRGVLPGQLGVWREALGRDMDLGGAVTSFGRTIAEGGGVLEAFGLLWAEMTGTETEQPEKAKDGDTVFSPQVSLPTPREQIEDPAFGGLPSLHGSGPDETAQVETDVEPAEAPADAAQTAAEPEQEPVVTAVPQVYDENGERLPDNVSFEYYNLGLEETAVPVVGSITSGFGFRDHPVSGEYTFHTAQDIGTPKGTDVLAFADGTVRYIGESSIYGLYVRLDHVNGVSTFYAHCQKLLVGKGDEVMCGQVIAKSGDTGNATGPHLHFSIDKDGVRLDPAWYLDGTA